MPTSILEAMAHGLPIIASDVGGISTIVDHRHCGLLFPPCDRSAFRGAVDRLIDDSALRAKLGRAAQQVARRYTWPNLIDELAPLIHSAIRV